MIPHEKIMKLSNILPPGIHTTDKPEKHSITEERCPRAIIGNVPAGAALHLAIAHELGERLRFQSESKGEFGVDDLTILDPAEVIPVKKGECKFFGRCMERRGLTII